MTDVVNVGSAPDAGDGDQLHLAFSEINTALAAAAAASPVTVSGLNVLTLSASTVNERVAQGTAIGNLVGRTTSSTLRMSDPNDMQFQIVGVALQAGPQLLEVGTVNAVVEETIDTGVAIITRTTTLPITVNRDAATWPVVVPTVWAGNAAAGTGDGSTYANRKLITSIPGTLAPGAIVGVAEDITLAASMTLSTSGTSGSHIKWIGVDSAGKRTQRFFTGRRWPYRKQTHSVEEVINLFTYSDPGIDGTNCFNLSAALKYVDFEDLGFKDLQIAFNVSVTGADNITIKRTFYRNVQRIFETTTAITATNVTIDGVCAALFSKALIDWRSASSGLAVSNVYADSMRADNDQWASLGRMDQTSANVTLTNIVVKNCHNNRGEDYWNADGWSIEENNDGLSITNYSSTGHTDAGIDLKTGTSLVNVIGGTIGDCKRNIKLWPGNSGDGQYHFEGVTLTAPNKRGGTGGACHINLNHGVSQPYATEVRCKDMDLRLFGQASANEISCIDTDQVAIVKYINVTRDAVPALANVTANVRFMIAAASPAGSPALSASSANLIDGAGGPIAITTNRDASYGGVIIRSIGGAAASLFQIDGPLGINQTISPVSPIAYTGTGADAKALTLTFEDIKGAQTTAAFTVNVVADTVDHRVLDVTFTGANNAQTATDASPAAHALTYGANAKISTTGDAAGRLRINFTANGTSTGKVSCTDSADWDIDGQWTLIAEKWQMDTAATTLKQTIAGRNNNSTGSNTWRLYVDATGHAAFDLHNSAGLAFTLAGSTVLSSATDYDFKVTRSLVSGSSYRWDLFVRATGAGSWGAAVATATNTTVPNDATGGIGIGSTTASRDYMAGYGKRIAIHKGTALGT